jgi:hypothetical protein
MLKSRGPKTDAWETPCLIESCSFGRSKILIPPAVSSFLLSVIKLWLPNDILHSLMAYSTVNTNN